VLFEAAHSLNNYNQEGNHSEFLVNHRQRGFRHFWWIGIVNQLLLCLLWR
jgi:hypothetical protein